MGSGTREQTPQEGDESGHDRRLQTKAGGPVPVCLSENDLGWLGRHHGDFNKTHPIIKFPGGRGKLRIALGWDFPAFPLATDCPTESNPMG